MDTPYFIIHTKKAKKIYFDTDTIASNGKTHLLEHMVKYQSPIKKLELLPLQWAIKVSKFCLLQNYRY